MSLLREIQTAATEGNTDIPSLLRKVKVLAYRLKNEELKKWVDLELNGYKDRNELPEYRKLSVTALGHFVGPFGSGFQNCPIPSLSLPENFRHFAKTAHLKQGVSAYAAAVHAAKDSGGGAVQVRWPADVVALVGDKIIEDHVLMDAWQVVSIGSLTQLLDTIQTRVLNFALELEAADPNAGEQTGEPSKLSTDQVTQAFTTIILGSGASVSIGGDVTSQTVVNDVRHMDFESLKETLGKLGVAENDIVDLESAMKSDGNTKDKKTWGKSVSGWVGSMVAKATSGAWKVATSAGAEVLSKALCKYYGLPGA